MRHTAAHPAAFTGRDISITASSWAWARGQTGATATAGVSIASAAAEEAGTTEAVTSAPVETPDTRTQRIDVVQHRHTPTTTGAPMRPRRITQRPTARPMPKQRMAAANTTRLHSDWWYDACSSGA